MNIEILKKISFDELENMIRKVPMLGNPQIFPYQNAHITMNRFRFDEVNPPQFYILSKNLQIQRELYNALSIHELDQLNLTNEIAGLEIKNLDSDEIWTLTPPIIEFATRNISYISSPKEIDHSNTKVKINIPLICDGLHRVAYSKERDGFFNGIKIVGANQDYPYYAHPNGWDMVKFVDQIPISSQEKKLYSRDDCYHLYRDFGIIGCGKPRYTGTKK